MKKMPIMILLLLIAALSGCLGSNETAKTDMQRYVRTNPNLDAKIVEVKFDRENITAGEKVMAELAVANTGTENITNETIEIIAKLNTLEDFWANLGSKFMSDKDKTRNYKMDFYNEIKPGTNGHIGAVFNTQQEIQGYNLAGTYEITVELFVNGQYADTKALELTLHKGTPREITFAPEATPTPAPIPTPMITQTVKPTPTPTPVSVPEIEVTPTGRVIYTRIIREYFGDPTLKIDAGDTVEWNNIDDFIYTLVEKDNKISNITIREGKRQRYTFNRTGDYHFMLIYSGSRAIPKEQSIAVRINTSQ